MNLCQMGKFLIIKKKDELRGMAVSVFIMMACIVLLPIGFFTGFIGAFVSSFEDWRSASVTEYLYWKKYPKWNNLWYFKILTGLKLEEKIIDKLERDEILNRAKYGKIQENMIVGQLILTAIFFGIFILRFMIYPFIGMVSFFVSLEDGLKLKFDVLK